MNSDRAKMRAFAFFVDAADGSLAHVRSEIYHFDVDGTVTGMATPGTDPDIAGNAPIEISLPGISVSVPSASVFADGSGNYLIPDLPASLVTVEAVLETPWVTVIADQGVDEVLTEDVTPTVLLPAGYLRDAVLRPAERRPPREVTYWNDWGRLRDAERGDVPCP